MLTKFLGLYSVIVVCSSTVSGQHNWKNKECSVVAAGYRFSFTMYKELEKFSKNMIFSPYSLSTASAMVMLGAAGKTEQELKGMLQYGVCDTDSKKVHESHRRVREFIEKESDGITLTVANRIFPDESFILRSDYEALSKYYYGSEVETMDFMLDVGRSREAINEWAENSTGGIIKDLLPPGSIDSLTLVVVANAIYFKGTWATPFNQRLTVEQDFHVDETTTVPTEFMVNKAVYKSASNSLFSLIELPYSGNAASMIILLPTEKFGLSALEDQLDGNFIRALNQYGFPREIRVRIPKFRMEFAQEMSGIYARLGVETLFGKEANFTAMSESEGMFISEIHHKAFIEVNEEGTEAAAATFFAGTRSLSMGVPTFTCDHPFIFYIVHKPSQAILFLGRYVEPMK